MDVSNWHNIDTAQLEKKLETNISQGLSNDEAASRLSKYGTNELQATGRKSLFKMFFQQFADFMVVILILAAVVSGLLGELTDAAIIIIIVVLNALLGTIQENKAEESLAALKRMAAPSAKVYRNGQFDKIPAAELVPGDNIILETGDFVPADMRIIEASNLKIQEAALTGESVPVEKSSKAIKESDIPLGDRINMAYTSSIVTYGRGRGIVVETGMNTEMGKIAEMIQSEEGVKTPLQKRLDVIGKTLGISALAICGIIFLIGILYGKDIFEMFLTSVSLAVAAIPEGLPAIVTIVLAIGVQRMAKRNAIIRKLPSVETLGSATVICSDKTGTLTQNKMTVQKIWTQDNIFDIKNENQVSVDQDETLKQLVYAAVLCNDAQLKTTEEGEKSVGDPTETALIDLGLKLNVNKNKLQNEMPRVAEIPFDSDRKLMSTVHKTNDSYMVFCKGAPDELLEKCVKIRWNNSTDFLTDDKKEKINTANAEMASNALRVLGMAYKKLPLNINLDLEMEWLEQDLCFLGLTGMIDPPRAEAAEAVKICKGAGIKPVMITGDHKVTAAAIAKDLGILDEGEVVISGFELDRMDDDDMLYHVKKCSVYARVSPEHKVRIVKAWQQYGDIVAMTGDGVNDAPALKRADIGAAMGIVGTDVAKEAADMVLTDDNFATVVAAVEEGRVIFANILKSIQFLLSCNVGEILVLLIATLLNWDAPLLPIHILWVNLVTDSLPALALGVDPAEKGIMNRKPRDPNRRVFDSGMIRRVIYQGLMVGGLTLVAFWIGKNTGNLETGQTMAFVVLAFSQLAHVHNVRSNTKSIFRTGLFSNIYLVGASLLSAMLQIAVISIPLLIKTFRVTILDTEHWIYVALLSLAPLLIVEIVKLMGLNTNRSDE